MGSSAASKAVPNPLLITSARHGHRPASSGKFITHSNFLGSSTSTLSSSRIWVPPVCRRSSAVSAVSSEVVKEKNVNSASPNLDNGQFEDKLKRRLLLSFIVGSSIYPVFPSSSKTKKQNPYDERRLLEQNKRIQRENNVPDDFPNFVREGFAVKVLTSNNYVTRDSGLVLWDIEVGKGDCPKDGQQVTFHYVGYNESGRRIDSTYLQGSPAKVRLGTNALIPGFEEGIRDMKPGGKRRMIIPPELGPPVGPSTFFSSKQFEVFDVELLSIQNCTRRTIGFYSDVVCG